MALLRITPRVAIDDSELVEHFVLASGPGGQNVNKVASAVQLRFDAKRSKAIPPDVHARLAALAGRRMTKDGVLVLESDRFRSQERNREDVRERLVELIRAALTVPKKRVKTKPSFASRKKRIEGKVKRGALKRARARPSLEG